MCISERGGCEHISTVALESSEGIPGTGVRGGLLKWLLGSMANPFLANELSLHSHPNLLNMVVIRCINKPPSVYYTVWPRIGTVRPLVIHTQQPDDHNGNGIYLLKKKRKFMTGLSLADCVDEKTKRNKTKWELDLFKQARRIDTC